MNFNIRAENNFASSLTTQFLQQGVVVPLQAQLAPLNAFTKKWEVDSVKPLATSMIKFAASGSTTQVDPTDFTANGDSAVTALPVVMHQLSHPFHLTGKQLNSGIELKDIFDVNIQAFARSIMDTVLAPVTTANFTLPVLTISPAAFGISDLDVLFGAIAKSKIKNLILAGSYFVKVLNKPGFFQPTGTASGGKWKPFGWDFIGQNDEWAGAEANTVGFACNPQAIGVVCGLPLQVDMPNVVTTKLTLPGVGLECLLNMWMDGNARTVYATFDIMLGTTACDLTAGVIIKSK
jgi:hypothetical protein